MNNTIPQLQKVFQGDFKVGAAVNKRTLHSARKLITNQFNSLTAENEMKPALLQPNEGEFDFTFSDHLIDFANHNDISVRGHTLVWHNQCPDWMFKNNQGTLIDRTTLLNRMDKHIETVVSRYAGQIDSWDVVNEAIADDEDVFFA